MRKDWITVFLRKARKKRKELPSDFFSIDEKGEKVFYLTKIYDWEVVETICAENMLTTSRKYYQYYFEHKNTLPNLKRVYARYGSWENFKKEIFGNFDIFKLNEEQIIRLVAFYNIETLKMYKKIRKIDKNLPGYYVVLKRFGGFRFLLRLARGVKIESIIERYIVLKEKLGRVPTITECNKSGVEYSRGVDIMGNEKKFLSMVNLVEECVNQLEGKTNEKQK